MGEFEGLCVGDTDGKLVGFEVGKVGLSDGLSVGKGVG